MASSESDFVTDDAGPRRSQRIKTQSPKKKESKRKYEGGKHLYEPIIKLLRITALLRLLCFCLCVGLIRFIAVHRRSTNLNPQQLPPSAP